jgi:hypothetical protein
MGNEKKLTSVKVDKELFEQFRINSLKMKFSFRELSERAMHLYNTDPEFKKMIHNTSIK